MNVLVLEPNAAERRVILSALGATELRVEVAVEATAAVTSVTCGSPDVVIVPWRGAERASVVRRLRGADSSGRAFLVGIVDDHAAAADIDALVEAGANDFLRRGAVRVELAARVHVARRLGAWASAHRAGERATLAAGPLQAWRDAGNLVARELEGNLGKSVRVLRGWSPTAEVPLRGAGAALARTDDRSELRLTLVVDPLMADWIRGTLLADAEAPDASVADALRELANLAVGAVKRAALPENIPLTSGLPWDVIHPVAPPGAACWSLELEGGQRIGLVAEVRESAAIRVTPGQLREGMVLLGDVRNPSGGLMAGAGTRLSRTSAERISQMLGARVELDVLQIR